MQQLHPKSIWLFFSQTYFFGFSLLIIFSIPFVTMILSAGLELSTPLVITIFAIFFGLVSYLLAVLTYNNWRYELTNNAIKIEKGVIWKKYISIPYERVQNVDINRGLLARLLRLSDLQIQTAGYSYSGSRGISSEGYLPGLDPVTAENLRDTLIAKVSKTAQGL